MEKLAVGEVVPRISVFCVSFIPSIGLTHLPLGVALIEGQNRKIGNHPKNFFFFLEIGKYLTKSTFNFFLQNINNTFVETRYHISIS